jgi:hypothetical protein
MASQRQSEFVAINEQTDDNVMHLNGFGEADRLTGKPLDACA